MADDPSLADADSNSPTGETFFGIGHIDNPLGDDFSCFDVE